MMPTSTIEVVVFDLGGVLAHFAGLTALVDLARIGPDDDIGRRWLSSPWVRRFESGACSPGEFGAGMVAEWRLDIDPADFLDRFGRWLGSPYPGADELVRAASESVRTACLSNTNALHWVDAISRWPLVEVFEHRFLSFELGLLKPDHEIFEHTLSSLGCAGDTVLFLDDSDANVDAASAAGMTAARVRGVVEARQALVGAGVLPGS